MPEQTDWKSAVAFAFWGGDQAKIVAELRARGADVALLPSAGPARAIWLLKPEEADAARALGRRRAIDGGDLGFNYEVWDADDLAIERATLGLFQSAPPGDDVVAALFDLGFVHSTEDRMLFERPDAWISVDAAFGRAYLESGDHGAGIDYKSVGELEREVKRLLGDLEELAAASELTDELADDEHEALLQSTTDRLRRAGPDLDLAIAALVLFEAGVARIAALTGSKLTPAELLETLVTDDDSVAHRLGADAPGRKKLARMFQAVRANLPARL